MQLTSDHIKLLAKELAPLVADLIAPPGKWLTMGEACKYAKVCKDVMLCWLRKGHVYGRKQGRDWIIDRESIDELYCQDRLILDL